MIGTAKLEKQGRARQKRATSSSVLGFQVGKPIQIAGRCDNQVLFRTAVYWHLDRRHQNEAILVRSLEAISRQHEGHVIGVVVVGDGHTLRIGYDRLSVSELPTDLEYDPFADGVSIYSPGATAPFFESAVAMDHDCRLGLVFSNEEEPRLIGEGIVGMPVRYL